MYMTLIIMWCGAYEPPEAPDVVYNCRQYCFGLTSSVHYSIHTQYVFLSVILILTHIILYMYMYMHTLIHAHTHTHTLKVLVCEKLELVNEYYFALVLDRAFMVHTLYAWYEPTIIIHVYTCIYMYMYMCVLIALPFLFV